MNVHQIDLKIELAVWDRRIAAAQQHLEKLPESDFLGRAAYSYRIRRLKQERSEIYYQAKSAGVQSDHKESDPGTAVGS